MMCRAVALALVALMGSVSARTPVCVLTDSCGKPTSAFPKLDKATCEKKYPTLDSFTCDMLDTTKRVCVQGNGGFKGLRTFPSKCATERFICQHLMEGKPNPPAYLFDGMCTLRGSNHCPLCAVRPPAPQACGQLGDKATKDTLKVYKDSCVLMTIAGCGIPGLKLVKMDVCTKAGVKYTAAPVMPAFEKKCRDQMQSCGTRGIKVCGDDQTTYADECSLYFENCMKSGKMGPAAKLVKMVYRGECSRKCDANTPCPSGQDCVGTCVPANLDGCAKLEVGCAKMNKRCYQTFFCQRMMTCGQWTACGSKPTPAHPLKCNANSLAGCIASIGKSANIKDMTPCGYLVAYSACAYNSRCNTAAQRFCTSGVQINVGGGTSKVMLPPNCVAPVCAKVKDTKCKVGEYQKCRDAAMKVPDLCKSYEADAKCIATTNCDEDLEATCYMAKWDGCKGQTLKTVCKASQSPIKELEGEHLMMYEYARLPARSGENRRASGALVGGVACAALLAVGLAALLVRRRRSLEGEAPAADYQAVEEEI